MAATQEEMVVRAGAPPAAKEQLAVALGQVSGDALDRADALAKEYQARIQPRVDEYVNWLRHPTAAEGDGARPMGAALGAPISNVCPFYLAFDVALAGPFELFSPVPFEPMPPQKVIGGGETAVFFALMFVNPVASTPCGFQIPPTTQLGGRSWRLRFEQINLSTLNLGLTGIGAGTFPGSAPSLSVIPFVFVAPNPGANPALMEVNLTADITDPGQPFAAFATNVFDPDNDPAFAGIPSTTPGWQHKLPLRYLVFPE